MPSDDELRQEGERYLRSSSSPYPYTDLFNEKFPYYLSIGMTRDEYWNDDPQLAKYYREAEQLRRERMNEEAWLQGMYIYDAIGRLAPILTGFAKKGTKPQPYVEQAYPLTSKQAKDIEEKKEKANAEKAKRYMETYMVAANKRFEKRGDVNANDN